MVNNKERILQQDNKELVARLGTEKWLVFPTSQDNEDNLTTFRWALLPLTSLETTQQEIDFWSESGMPGCTRYGSGDDARTVYHRFGNDEGIEPLLIRREFHDLREGHTEISEEFRLFHNLYFDRKAGKYLKFDPRGEVEEVIVIEGETTKIRLKHIRQFLAVKEMMLVVYFNIIRCAKETLPVLGLIEINEAERQPELLYDFSVSNTAGLMENATMSLLRGQKLIFGCEKEKSDFWPYNERKQRVPDQHERFIIGVDGDEEPVLAASNPGFRDYLTPVFFKREVLAKYYGDSNKYQIQDNILFCGSLWSLQMDNNHQRYVIVYLGDLGRLSAQEQGYWKSFNVVPDGKISDAEFKRSFLAEAAEPEQADLIFKAAYERFCELWMKKQGWSLFKPLNREDRHALIGLHVPLTKDFSEFDAQLLFLTKLLVDSLNDAEIKKRVADLDSNLASIGKLEAFLKQEKAQGYELHIKFLRDLYRLRSKGAGHRKGSDYQKEAAAFGLEEKELPEILSDFLKGATAMLLFLEESLLTTPQNELV